MSPIHPRYSGTCHRLLRRSCTQSTRTLTTSSKTQSPSTYPNALPKAQRTPKAANRSPAQRTGFESVDSNTYLRNTVLSNLSGPRKSNNLTTAESLERAAHLQRLETSQTRNWRPGDVYAPHDLSPAEMQKIKKSTNSRTPGRGLQDPFKALNANPLDFYKNYAVMSEFCGPSMKIKSRFETGLGNVNQRKYAKAVRRAIGMGLMPSVHQHPEVVEIERRQANEKLWGRDGKSGFMNRL